MSKNKFSFPVGYHDFHSVNEREIGNGPHFYQGGTGAESLPEREYRARA